jgi:hypothetical protein
LQPDSQPAISKERRKEILQIRGFLLSLEIPFHDCAQRHSRQ